VHGELSFKGRLVFKHHLVPGDSSKKGMKLPLDSEPAQEQDCRNELVNLFEDCGGRCGDGFWRWPRRRGRRSPTAGIKSKK
jgi:hypothetical protein